MKDVKERQTVLIVEDTKTNLMIMTDLLKDEWDVKAVTTGKAALQYIKEEKLPDIILLDIIMPDMDGYEVCAILKCSPDTKDIPIIFITSKCEGKDEEYGLSLGAIDYITKPFKGPILKARVKNHLELKRYRDLLKKVSMVDGLTGVPNRRRFDEALSAEWRRALRYENNISLVMIDIDHFKPYNDTYGHLEGDQCLRNVAITMKNALNRPLDLLARWGGEEFVCLLPDTGNDASLKIAERLRSSVYSARIPHKSSPTSDVLTISLGVSTVIPKEINGFDILLEQADKALYAAKRAGRNMVMNYNDGVKYLKEIKKEA